jgi:hypothetical protein
MTVLEVVPESTESMPSTSSMWLPVPFSVKLPMVKGLSAALMTTV